MMRCDDNILTRAAQDAMCAPSPLNTQPWTWHHEDGALQLYADRDRQLTVADPQGRLLVLSCGIALHHAAVSVAAAGYTPQVERFVASFEDNRLARLSVGAPRAVTDADRLMAAAIQTRRTDRRPFADRHVTEPELARLADAATTAGARLHVVRLGQMPMLAIAAAQAGTAEMSDPAYRNELMRWTNRPPWSGDGVPPAATVQRVPRRVPVRELALEPQTGQPIEPGGDRGAAYVVVFGNGDAAPDWFTGGEATSAVLLTATALGLATAPITDVIEVPHPRDLITGLLPAGGYPYLVVRCGWSDTSGELAHAPRRPAAEAIIGNGGG
jgi:hypothetical protein